METVSDATSWDTWHLVKSGSLLGCFWRKYILQGEPAPKQEQNTALPMMAKLQLLYAKHNVL